nr:condensation domain-containing protein [Pseudofrankia sp. EUN1h]
MRQAVDGARDVRRPRIDRVVVGQAVADGSRRRTTHRHPCSLRPRHVCLSTCPLTTAYRLESCQAAGTWHRRAVPVDPAGYNHAVVVDVFGALSADALRSALAAVTARHEALRTVVEVADGRPRPRVVPTPPPTVEWADMTDIARMDGLDGQGMTYAVRSRVDRAFDLAGERPLRVTVFRIDDGFHRLLLVLQLVPRHDATNDAAHEWSDGPLLADLAAAYAARVAHAGPSAAVSWSRRGAAR